MAAAIYLGRAYPKHEAAFLFARTSAASLVRRGAARISPMISWLQQWVRRNEPAPMPVGNPGLIAELAIVHVLQDAIANAPHHEMNVRRAVAPLLDRGATDDAINAAASRAADRYLDDIEIALIVAEEKAWWVRLNVELDEVPHAA